VLDAEPFELLVVGPEYVVSRRQSLIHVNELASVDSDLQSG
jgi:hypothetical protein